MFAPKPLSLNPDCLGLTRRSVQGLIEFSNFLPSKDGVGSEEVATTKVHRVYRV